MTSSSKRPSQRKSRLSIPGDGSRRPQRTHISLLGYADGRKTYEKATELSLPEALGIRPVLDFLDAIEPLSERFHNYWTERIQDLQDEDEMDEIPDLFGERAGKYWDRIRWLGSIRRMRWCNRAPARGLSDWRSPTRRVRLLVLPASLGVSVSLPLSWTRPAD